jgi:hypothetical protein
MRPVSSDPASLTPRTIVASFHMWTDDHVSTPPVSLDVTSTNYATLHRRCQGKAARCRGQVFGMFSGNAFHPFEGLQLLALTGGEESA